MKVQDVKQAAATGDLAALTTACGDDSDRVRKRGLEALAEIGGPDAADALATVATADADPQLRLAASEALAGWHDPRAGFGLTSVALGREHERLHHYRARAIGLLGDAGDPSVTPVLIAALDPAHAYDNHEIGVALASVQALGSLGDPMAVEHIGQLLIDDKVTTAVVPLPQAAITALSQIGGPDASGWLVSFLHRGPEARKKFGEEAVAALRSIADPDSLPILEALGDGTIPATNKLQQAAQGAAAEIRDRAPAAATEPPGGPRREEFRRYVMDLLGERLAHAQLTDDRTSAARALGRVGGADAPGILFTAFDDVSVAVRREAATACGEIVAESSLSALLNGLRAGSDQVQLACAAALGRLADDPEMADQVIDALLADAAASGFYAEAVQREIAYALAVSERDDARLAVEAMLGQGVNIGAGRSLLVIDNDRRRERVAEHLKPDDRVRFVVDDKHGSLVGFEDRVLHAHGRRVDEAGFEKIHVVDLGQHQGSASAGKAIAMGLAFGALGASGASTTVYATVAGEGISYDLRDPILAERAWPYLAQLEDEVAAAAAAGEESTDPSVGAHEP